MRQEARATLILGLSATFPPLAGLLAVKAWATCLGPAGYGRFSLLQAATVLLSIVADFGIGSSLVREGAKRLATQTSARPIWQAASRISIIVTGGVFLASVLFRRTVERHLLAGSTEPIDLWLCLTSFPFVTFAGIRVAMLTAHSKVKIIALQNAASALLSVIATITCILVLRERATGPALIANALARWGVAAFALRHATGIGIIWPFGPGEPRMVRHLLSIGVPLMLSMLVGPGASMLVPSLIAPALGASGVGFYQSAQVMAMSAFAILSAGLSQDFFPKISQMPTNAPSFKSLLHDQTTFALLATATVVGGTLAVGTLIVPVFFARSFDGLLQILPWQLVGLLFQMAAAPVSFAVLAHLKGLSFFIPALTTGLTLLPLSWLLSRELGAPGVGIAFAVSAACNWAANIALGFYRFGHVESKRNIATLSALSGVFSIIAWLYNKALPTAIQVLLQATAAVVTVALALTLWGFSKAPTQLDGAPAKFP